ncbi:hypothetical protein DAI43_10490 [Achromobacter xylosoxidans]|uniref:hypothetical protein n=1 Tax=Achromobacter aegrifaciens TaxID=1287736 RepID=UPI000D447D74|nr:hypothetical protein [Achromobacter aegrifaciens]MDQ1759021.1 hypothetical protein [Achromobacter aegrifaciens]PTN51408.1 hypothetical protein DAI43_10490 [Achromobacter xylosoxidans]
MRTLTHFDPARLDTVWPEVAPMLNAALSKGEGELDLSQLRLLITARQAELVLVVDEGALVGAIAIEFIQYPNYRVANFIATGGRRLFARAGDVDQLKAWLKERGATKIQGYCPPAVARLWCRLGFHVAYQVVRCDI